MLIPRHSSVSLALLHVEGQLTNGHVMYINLNQFAMCGFIYEEQILVIERLLSRAEEYTLKDSLQPKRPINMRLLLLISALEALGFNLLSAASTFKPARPPAVPLAVRSPYLNTWLQNDSGNILPGSWPTFWT